MSPVRLDPLIAPPGFGFLFFAVILPAFTVTLELAFRLCGSALFDFFPGWAYAIPAAAVPVLNGTAFYLMHRGGGRQEPQALAAVLLATWLAVPYAVVLLPVLPFAAIALLFFVGLPVFAPLGALVAGWRLIERYPLPLSVILGQRWIALLAAAGLLAPLLFYTPVLWTRAETAAILKSTDPQDRAGRIAKLRQFGDRSVLLHAMAGEGRWLEQFFLPQVPGGPEARQLYFQVTGRTVTEDEPKFRDMWDRELGGSEIGMHRQAISVRSSRQEILVHPDAGFAYSEWTVIFHNSGQLNEEARAILRLPGGGVVSKVSLWIDGEERPAAFGGAAEARDAYRTVTARRLDPLLVSYRTPESALVQCSPILPGGGMKIRIGITSPVDPDSPGAATLRLPRFTDANFTLESRTPHTISVESTRPVELAAAIPSARTYRNGSLLQAELPFRDLAHGLGVRVSLPVEPGPVALRLPDAGGYVTQSLTRTYPDPARRIAVVVDAGAELGPYASQMRDVLVKLKPGRELLILAAGDQVVSLGGRPEDLARIRFQGGTDPVPALAEALRWLGPDPNAALLWIHGRAPLPVPGADGLRSAASRLGAGRFVVLGVTPGENSVRNPLAGLDSVRTSHASFIDLPETLQREVARINGSAPAYRFDRVWTSQPPPGLSVSDAPIADGTRHILRLWANEESGRLARSRRPGNRDRARELAIGYQLVTPLVSAVVLETARQYQAFGLQPGDPAFAPAVPEPGTWVIVATGLALGLWYQRRRRRPKVTL